MVNRHSFEWNNTASFPSVHGAGHRALLDLLNAMRERQWPESDVFGVHLAVEEAIVNAIRHGNQLDANRNVSMQCRVSADRVHIELADQGDGFDPSTVPDCTVDENLHRPNGRGIMLMRNYMSRVEYSQGGNCLVMEKLRARTP